MTEAQAARMIALLESIDTRLAILVDRPAFDPHAPVNMYGEGLAEGIQNSIARGLRGIETGNG